MKRRAGDCYRARDYAANRSRKGAAQLKPITPQPSGKPAFKT